MSLQREEYIKKRRKKQMVKICIFFLVLLGLFGLSAYGSHRSEVRIAHVELSGEILVRQADVEAETLQYLYGSYFWVFPKGNAFWYPKTSLELDLKSHFKRIDTITIKRKNLTTLSIEISERKPYALWCDSHATKTRDTEDLSTSTPTAKTVDLSGPCYFMDNNSTIFTPAPSFSGDAYFKYYGLISTSTSIIGQEYITSGTQFRAITDFIESVKGMKINPVYLLAKGDDQYTLVLASGAKIYFDTKSPLTDVSSNLETLLHSGSFSTTSDLSVGVDYIDLRFGNKLFYKLK